MKHVTKILLLAALVFPALVWSQKEASGDALFVNLDGVKGDARGGVDTSDEAVFASMRGNLTDDEVNALKSSKGDQYNKIFDLMRDQKWEDCLIEMKTYIDIIRQAYAPGDYGYREVFSEVFYLYGTIYQGLGNYVDSVRNYQRLLSQYKDSKYAIKACVAWANTFFKIYTGELRAPEALPVPSKALMLKRALYLKTIKADADELSDMYLLAADVCIREKDFAEAKGYLKLIQNEFPRSEAADKVSERMEKCK